MPSSAESAERLLLFQTLAALVMFTAGSSIMMTTRSSATSCRERDVRGRPSMSATRRRTAVSLNAFTSATSIWSGSSSTVWLIACSTTFVTVEAAWAEAPGRAGRECDASCLGIEAWWGILAVAEATHSTTAPEGASRARHCGRRLSGAHGACRALEAHGLATHAHEAAGRARHTRAQTLRACNSAWAAWRLLRTARWRKVAHAGLGALIGTGEAGGAGMRALLARQRRAGAHWAVRPLLTRLALRLLLLVLERAFSARRAETHARLSCDRAGAAGPRCGATRGRVEARLGRVALRGAAEIGKIRVRALLARQWRAGAKRAEVTGLAGEARLLALAGLVRAGRALVARSLPRDELNGAGAAGRLLGAACRCEVALVRRRALVGAGEVCLVGVRPPATRQRRRRTLRAKGSALARA
eukprot:scaffold7352_cov55-Phaeocystis_antarctica.AAC.3